MMTAQTFDRPSLGAYIALALALSLVVAGAATAFGFWRVRSRRWHREKHETFDRRSEEDEDEDIKNDLDDEYNIGTPRSPARVTAVLNTPGAALFASPTVALAIRYPDRTEKSHLSPVLDTNTSPSRLTPLNASQMPSTPPRVRPLALPLASIEELDEDIEEQEAQHRPRNPPRQPTQSEAADAARNFEEAVQRFMHHMSDQRAFVQDHTEDARASNRRESMVIDSIVSVLAEPGEIHDEKEETEQMQEDFVSFAWSYYGTNTYENKLSTTSSFSAPLDCGDDQYMSSHDCPNVPRILVSAH